MISQSLVNSLSLLEICTLIGLKKGFSHAEIAEHLDCTTDAVGKIVEALKQKTSST